MRVENLLLAAQQTVIALATQLQMADKKLRTIEDLIGEVRTRMYARGLATHPVVQRKRQSPRSAPLVNVGNITDHSTPRKFSETSNVIAN